MRDSAKLRDLVVAAAGSIRGPLGLVLGRGRVVRVDCTAETVEVGWPVVALIGLWLVAGLCFHVIVDHALWRAWRAACAERAAHPLTAEQRRNGRLGAANGLAFWAVVGIGAAVGWIMGGRSAAIVVAVMTAAVMVVVALVIGIAVVIHRR